MIPSFFQLFLAPVKGHPGPGLRPAQNFPDLPETQSPERTQIHHLPPRLRQGVDAPQQRQVAVPVHRLRLGRGQRRQPVVGLRQRLLPAPFADVLVKKVLCDLAQPGRHLAAPVKAVRRPHRLVKGLLGQLLRCLRIMAQGEKKLIDCPGMGAVNFLHGFHGRLPPLFVHKSPAGIIRYTPGQKFKKEKRGPFRVPFRGPPERQPMAVVSNISSKERR